jgi:hypothetical protein
MKTRAPWKLRERVHRAARGRLAIGRPGLIGGHGPPYAALEKSYENFIGRTVARLAIGGSV